MVTHYIFMSSDYAGGARVALDITDEELLKVPVLDGILNGIRAECGEDVALSTHMIVTDSADWDSVVKYDPFFEGVVRVDSAAAFSARIKKSRILSGLGVANYILSIVRCTHLSLEKLAYFAYADYLCRTQRRLFEDRIYAFTYGPVVESIYEVYKRSSYEYVKPLRDNFLHPGIGEMPAKSRILFAHDGIEKLDSINGTIKRYGGCTAQELVALTHRSGSPWSSVDSSTPYQVISDDLILERHHVECLP